MLDSEIAKEQCALRSGRLRINGYQGCVNYGKQIIDTPEGPLDLGNACNFDGYYLAEYSREGLCSECEQKQFPERYHGCLFCRCPLKNDCGPSCLWCEVGFQKWGSKLFKSKGKYYDRGLFCLAKYGLNKD